MSGKLKPVISSLRQTKSDAKITSETKSGRELTVQFKSAKTGTLLLAALLQSGAFRAAEAMTGRISPAAIPHRLPVLLSHAERQRPDWLYVAWPSSKGQRRTLRPVPHGLRHLFAK
ncbi:hypothetical protein E4U57_006695 [Claviceps arundinis]|uniref:Uncharacterized protein n=1 Tax=Claviceps arundinis TaxID=1623583 RepID=A0ABQ7PH04_9HYPO|nr:hypothetical protein E4U57_006695 [Claviceps arundinis]